MITRPLTAKEEPISNQVAGIFYQPVESSITQNIKMTLSNQSADTAEAIIGATLSRLYSEQAARREYLVKGLNLQTTSRDEQVTQLLSMSESATPSTASQDTRDQLSYFKAVSINLLSYEAEQWATENSALLTIILRLSPQIFQSLLQSLEAYNAAFYQNHAFENIGQISIPDAVIEALKAAGIAVELSHYETLIQKSSFLAFLQQACQLIVELRNNGVNDEKDILKAVGIATLRFKSILTPTA